jgi:hypothetical protein
MGGVVLLMSSVGSCSVVPLYDISSYPSVIRVPVASLLTMSLRDSVCGSHGSVSRCGRTKRGSSCRHEPYVILQRVVDIHSVWRTVQSFQVFVSLLGFWYLGHPAIKLDWPHNAVVVCLSSYTGGVRFVL